MSFSLIPLFSSADALYDLGTGLDVLSPLCPQLFLELAGLGNFAKVYFFVQIVFVLSSLFICTCIHVSLISVSFNNITVHKNLKREVKSAVFYFVPNLLYVYEETK